MRELKINNIKKETKLQYYIKDTFPNLPSTMLHKAIRNKDIKINGKRTTNADFILNNGDTLQLYIDDSFLYGMPRDLEICYEDDNIVIVYKPQGVLSNNEDDKKDEYTFEDYVQKKLGENIHICHRLDRNTSGLLVFSKNDIAFEQLNEAFKNGYILKEYIAYVSGSSFSKKSYHYDNYILKDTKTGFSKIYDKKVSGSSNILTDVFVEYVNTKLDYSILKVHIHTGKTHQIRALLSSINRPIIGDSKYGKNEINKKFKKYKQLLFAVRYAFNFPENSPLNYLNEKEVLLDESKYLNQI